MKYLNFALACALFAGSFLFAYRYGVLSSEALTTGSTVCPTASLLAEVEEAESHDDIAWLGSIHTCGKTKATLNARVLDCDWLMTCHVRYWASDALSLTGYVRANRLAH